MVSVERGRVVVEPDLEHLAVDGGESGDSERAARTVELGACAGEHPILRGERAAEQRRGLAGPAAQIGSDALQRLLVRLHHLEARHDRIEQPVARALRFAGNAGLGQHLGIDLGLEGAEDVALAGELAAEIGEADIGRGGDVGEADLAPASVFGELERRPHGFGTLGEIVEHGGYSFTGKIGAFRGGRKARLP